MYIDVLYLTACVVNGKVIKHERIDKLDLSKLFEVCQKHILTACVAYTLESEGAKDNGFTQAKENAIRKNILLGTERRTKKKVMIRHCFVSSALFYIQGKIITCSIVSVYQSNR